MCIATSFATASSPSYSTVTPIFTPWMYCASFAAVWMRSKRRTAMFSPIFCTSFWRALSTVSAPSFFSESAATSRGLSFATICASPRANAVKSGFFATKSVSQFTSTIAAVLPSPERYAPIAPSAATREAALEALAPLLMRKSSSAFFMSPPASSSAFLHSIMPSPVSSRSSFTMPAVISAISILSITSFPRRRESWIPAGAGDDVVELTKKGLCIAPFSPHPCAGPLLLLGVLDLDELLARLRHHLGHDLAAALEDRVRHAAGVEPDGARRIVVAGDHVVDAVERVVGVDDAHDRDAERARLGDRDLVEAHVDHEQRIGNAAHVLDATQRALELLALAVEMQLLLLRQALERAVGDHLVHFLQALDRLLHGLEVREHSAQPAVVDVRRARAPRLFLDDLARLALGAHEEDGPLVGGELAHELERFLVHRKRLLEVDDVDLVARPEDERSHLGVPVARLVAEVHAGLQHLAHGDGHPGNSCG